MKVIQQRKIEDCLDGSFIREFEFDQEISREFIDKLGQGHALEYFPKFPRPFFRIEKKNEYQIKGVLSNVTIKVIFYRHCSTRDVEKLIQLINNC